MELDLLRRRRADRRCHFCMLYMHVSIPHRVVDDDDEEPFLAASIYERRRRSPIPIQSACRNGTDDSRADANERTIGCQVQKWIRDLAVSERIRPSRRRAVTGRSGCVKRNDPLRIAVVGRTGLTCFMVERNFTGASTRLASGAAQEILLLYHFATLKFDATPPAPARSRLSKPTISRPFCWPGPRSKWAQAHAWQSRRRRQIVVFEFSSKTCSSNCQPLMITPETNLDELLRYTVKSDLQQKMDQKFAHEHYVRCTLNIDYTPSSTIHLCFVDHYLSSKSTARRRSNNLSNPIFLPITFATCGVSEFSASKGCRAVVASFTDKK